MVGLMRNVVIGLVCGSLILAMELAEAERPLKFVDRGNNVQKEDGFADFILQLWNLSKSGDEPSRPLVWPEMRFGWRIVLGSIIGFFGAALGSIGGVGGGGIFVPMLTLIIGFDPKSSTAISKCMIMGAAGSTVYYNLRLRHPTLDLPIIDYDLALLFQPMLMLGISIGVAFNVMFADWMVIRSAKSIFEAHYFVEHPDRGTSTKAFFKGIETWKKETVMKKEAAKLLESYGKMNSESESPKTPPFPQEVYEDGPTLGYRPLPGGPSSNRQQKLRSDKEVSLTENVYWRDLMLLVLVWIAFFTIQIVKTYAKTCSIDYWILNSLQVPIALSVTLYEGISLYTGKRTIASDGKQDTNWKVHQLFLYCCLGILAGIVGGLLGLGGGFILGPLFLELGVPPQVASATSTFAMTFSASMSVVQNYLLNRFPIPYAFYFMMIATIAALVGQHIVRKLVVLLGRASLIIFILALTIFVSAISLGGVGIANIVEKVEHREHMGFESLCSKT